MVSPEQMRYALHQVTMKHGNTTTLHDAAPASHMSNCQNDSLRVKVSVCVSVNVSVYILCFVCGAEGMLAHMQVFRDVFVHCFYANLGTGSKLKSKNASVTICL